MRLAITLILLLLSVVCVGQTTAFYNGPTGACSYDNQSGINCEGVDIGNGYWINFFIVNAPGGMFPPNYAQLWIGTYYPSLVTWMNAAQHFGGTVTPSPTCVSGKVCITIQGTFTDNPQYPSVYQSGTITEYLTITCARFRGCRPTMLDGSGTLSH